MTQKGKYHRTTIRIDPKLWRELQRMSKSIQRPVSSLYRAAIQHALTCEQFKEDLVKASLNDVDRVTTFFQRK